MPSISIPTAILGAGVLGIGGSIASSVIGSNAATTAANAQVTAAQTAANTQLGIFNQTQSNLAPYNQAGQSALSQLASLFGLSSGGTTGTGPTASTAAGATSALTNYPGYQFGLQQGTQALDRSAASNGLLLSGGQLKAAQQYGQGYAMQNAWNPYVSQLNTTAGLGENAAATTGNIGASTGSSVANSQLAAGQASASGTVGSANAITGGINSSIYSGLNSGLLAYGLQQNQYGSGLQGQINSGNVMGVSNGGYNYIDAAAG
jgi:hypothetical protein